MASTAPTGLGKVDPTGLRLLVREHGTTSTIELDGEWDLAVQESVRTAICHALERRPECVVLDLSQLTFIDSSGIHGVVELVKRSQRENFRVVIIPGASQIQRVFELCGLIEALPFLPEA